MPISHINDTLDDLSISERLRYIYKCYAADEILLTSSFGTSSAFLLYHISLFDTKPDIYFINTGFLFSATIKYREELEKLFKLNVIDVRPAHDDHSFTEYEKLWETDPDSCCFLNKVKPLNEIKSRFKVWVTGLMANQPGSRDNLSIVQKDGDILKFNPLFDQDPAHINDLLRELKVPLHPLLQEGYDSVGCLQCTTRGAGRSGRWSGLDKTECGLHSNVKRKTSKE